MRRQALAPGLTGGAALERGRDLEPPPTLVLELGGDGQRAVDMHRLEEPDGEAGGDGREAVPGREQPAGLVQRGADEAAVDESRRRLVLFAEGERCVVRAQTLPLGGG